MFQSIEAGDLGLLPVIEKISTGIEIGCSQGRKAGLSGRGLMMDMHRKPNEYNRAGQMGIFLVLDAGLLRTTTASSFY